MTYGTFYNLLADADASFTYSTRNGGGDSMNGLLGLH